MVERDSPVYCTQWGSILNTGDNICGMCGASVSPNAHSVAPTLNGVRILPTMNFDRPSRAPTTCCWLST
jgi:hypothetical protein